MVRGVAMNPVDHPHGGGEGKPSQGNPHPVSPWGWHTKGKKTEGEKFKDYFDFSQSLSKLPSHRILAMFREGGSPRTADPAGRATARDRRQPAEFV